MLFFDNYIDTVSYEMFGKVFTRLNNRESLYVTARINTDVLIYSNLRKRLYDYK